MTTVDNSYSGINSIDLFQLPDSLTEDSSETDLKLFNTSNRCRLCGRPYKANIEYLTDSRFFNLCHSCRMMIIESDKENSRKQGTDFWDV